MNEVTADIFDQLCAARSVNDRLRGEVCKLQGQVNVLVHERNDAVQAVNTLRDEPSGEVWVKQEFSSSPEGWSPAVTIGPQGESRYVNAATLDRALCWFWKNTFENFTRQQDYELPACRLINIRTGQTIPLTIRAVPRVMNTTDA